LETDVDVSSRSPADVVRRNVVSIAAAHQQAMANSSIADDRFTLDDLSNDINFVVSEQYPNTFANRCCVAADRDKLPVATNADRDVAGEAEDAFCA
jgi:hypothetical protein